MLDFINKFEIVRSSSGIYKWFRSLPEMSQVLWSNRLMLGDILRLLNLSFICNRSQTFRHDGLFNWSVISSDNCLIIIHIALRLGTSNVHWMEELSFVVFSQRRSPFVRRVAAEKSVARQSLTSNAGQEKIFTLKEESKHQRTLI